MDYVDSILSGLEKDETARTSTFTLADIQAAMVKCAQMEAETAARVAENLHRFWESVPEHLRSDPLIAEMSAIVASDQPIHPKLADDYRRRLYHALTEGSTPCL